MPTATLPSPADIVRAAADDEFYAQIEHTLSETGKQWFRREVEAAYNAARAPRPLTYEQRRILAFEHKRFRTAGGKQAAIRDEFGYSAAGYYQALNALLDHPAALKADPVTVARLRRLRDLRQARRAGRPDATRSAA